MTHKNSQILSQPPDSQPIVLIINHNRRNLELMTQLLTPFLAQRGYQILATVSLETVDPALSRPHTIKLALIDISGFDARIWEFCQRLRQQQVPFVVISPQQQAAIQQASAMSGARNYLIKPLVMKELLRLVWTLLGEAD